MTKMELDKYIDELNNDKDKVTEIEYNSLKYMADEGNYSIQR